MNTCHETLTGSILLSSWTANKNIIKLFFNYIPAFLLIPKRKKINENCFSIKKEIFLFAIDFLNKKLILYARP